MKLSSNGYYNKRRPTRYFIGVVGVLALYAGWGALFLDDASLFSLVLRYVRYTLIGLWISWGSPLVFEKLGVGVIKPHFQPQRQHQGK